MNEISTALLVDVDDHRNVTDLLVERERRAPAHAAFDVRDAAGAWRTVTTRAYADAVRALAKGLIATGVQPGDAVAIMAPTRYEWAVADLAIWFAGGVVVPIYDTSAPAQVEAIVADAGVRLAIGGTAAQTALLAAAFASTAAGDLGAWSMDAGDGRTIETLSARAFEVDDTALEIRRTTADIDSPATIVYTSGTTGEPKGAVLTHRNFLGQVLNIAAAYGEVVHEEGNTIIFLPLAHVLARGLQLICLAGGMRIAHLSDPTEVVATLSELRPTFLVVVPRVLQKIQAAAGQKAADKHLGGVWSAATTTAIAWGRHLETTTPAPWALRVRRALFDRLFFARLRTVMGGRVDYILSGGATLDARLSLFFRGIGAPVVEGYGLTETTAPLTGNLPGDIRSGTVGRPLPGSTVRISTQGEILARGIGVFHGYRDPRHDAESFVDGFFRTGDLGHLDEDGRLVLEGRLKEVIVTSNGKTVVPAVWERTVESSPLVSHAVMVGEGRSYLSALVLVDPAEAAGWLRSEGIAVDVPTGVDFAELVEPALRRRIQQLVDEANALVARSEQVRRFTVLSTDLDDATLVTPTMKIKRRAVLERGAHAVAELYA